MKPTRTISATGDLEEEREIWEQATVLRTILPECPPRSGAVEAENDPHSGGSETIGEEVYKATTQALSGEATTVYRIIMMIEVRG